MAIDGTEKRAKQFNKSNNSDKNTDGTSNLKVASRNHNGKNQPAAAIKIKQEADVESVETVLDENVEDQPVIAVKIKLEADVESVAVVLDKDGANESETEETKLEEDDCPIWAVSTKDANESEAKETESEAEAYRIWATSTKALEPRRLVIDTEAGEEDSTHFVEGDTLDRNPEVELNTEAGEECSEDFAKSDSVSRLYESTNSNTLFVPENYAASHRKKHKCPHCTYSTNDISNLRKHLCTHTGEKKYQCNVCGRRFSQNQNLQYHLLTHTGEKPFPCNICSRGFRRKDELKTHMNTHVGVLP